MFPQHWESGFDRKMLCRRHDVPERLSGELCEFVARGLQTQGSPSLCKASAARPRTTTTVIPRGHRVVPVKAAGALPSVPPSKLLGARMP